MQQQEVPGVAPTLTHGSDSTGARPLRLSLLVAGLYAWLTTVAAPTFGSASTIWPQVTALLAPVGLVGGVLLTQRSIHWGRRLTLLGFLGLSAATWLLLGDSLDVERLEPVRAALGGVGWVAFAFSWGVVREQGAVPENDPRVIRAKPLRPKRSMPTSIYAVLAVSLLGAAVPWFTAWRSVRPEHGLFAHATALLCAVAVIAAGTYVASSKDQKRVMRRPIERLNSASASLALLIVLGMLGLVVWAIRGA